MRLPGSEPSGWRETERLSGNGWLQDELSQVEFEFLLLLYSSGNFHVGSNGQIIYKPGE